MRHTVPRWHRAAGWLPGPMPSAANRARAARSVGLEGGLTARASPSSSKKAAPAAGTSWGDPFAVPHAGKVGAGVTLAVCSGSSFTWAMTARAAG